MDAYTPSDSFFDHKDRSGQKDPRPHAKEPWDALLDRFTRTGNNHGEKREIHEELQRRVRAGYQGNEQIAPLRLFHQ